MRISVALDDLEPASGAGDGSASVDGRNTAVRLPAVSSGEGRSVDAGATNVEAIRLTRARTVASSLDLRGARVEEALEVLERYIEEASLGGLPQVIVIHGMGTGALRDAVRSAAAGHPLVVAVRAGERGEGGDGATIIRLA